MRPTVIVAEPLAAAGLERLERDCRVEVVTGGRDALLAQLARADAVIVRSATRVDDELLAAAPALRVVGRAGTGVDNVDVVAATRRGILVCNAPGSNALAAAEHAFALLLAVARNVPQAAAALRDGRWERDRFGGVELADKTLTLVGFGRVGQLVAARARAFAMEVAVYDPFVSDERVRELGGRRVADLLDAVAVADFVSLHLPATPATSGIVDARILAAMRPTARLVNAARGELIDEDALLAALRDGRLAGAALDVFAEEPATRSPLLELDCVVATPHLGASTAEAQERAGVAIADQVARALAGRPVEGAVNVPALDHDARAVLEPFLPVGERLGRAVAALSDGIDRIDVAVAGDLAAHDTTLVARSVLLGVLADDDVNLVSAEAVAASRGIELTTSRAEPSGYASLVTVSTGTATVAGTTIGADHRPWLVAVDDYAIEIELTGTMVLLRNPDRPGMIGRIGTTLGAAGVNIATMDVSRTRPGGSAMTAIVTDGDPPEAAVAALAAVDGVERLRVVRFDR